MIALAKVKNNYRMHTSCHRLIFLLDKQQLGLHLAAVQRVVRAVEIISLAKAPEIVLGAINVQGQIVPAVNVRRRFRPSQEE